MANPYVNKVIYGSTTLIDLTADTATASNVEEGYTAHNCAGASVTGTLRTAVPIEIATEAGMTAVMIAANVGKAYKYTGTTTSNYINGDIYVVTA